MRSEKLCSLAGNRWLNDLRRLSWRGKLKLLDMLVAHIATSYLFSLSNREGRPGPDKHNILLTNSKAWGKLMRHTPKLDTPRNVRSRSLTLLTPRGFFKPAILNFFGQMWLSLASPIRSRSGVDMLVASAKLNGWPNRGDPSLFDISPLTSTSIHTNSLSKPFNVFTSSFSKSDLSANGEKLYALLIFEFNILTLY